MREGAPAAPGALRASAGRLRILAGRDLGRMLSARRSYGLRTGLVLGSLLVLAWNLPRGGSLATAAGDFRAMYFAFFHFVLLCTFLAAPALGLAAMREERETRTFELLHLAGYEAWELLGGKAVALVAVMILVVLSLLPLLGMGLVLGAVDLYELVCLPLSVLTAGVWGVAAGLLFGTYSVSTLGGVVRTVAFYAVWGLAAPRVMLAVIPVIRPDGVVEPLDFLVALTPVMPASSLPFLQDHLVGASVWLAPLIYTVMGVLGAALMLFLASSVLWRIGASPAAQVLAKGRGIRRRVVGLGARIPAGRNPVAWREGRLLHFHPRSAAPGVVLGAALAIELGLHLGFWEGKYALLGGGPDWDQRALLDELLIAGSYAAVFVTALRAYSGPPHRRQLQLLAATPLPRPDLLAGKLAPAFGWAATLAAAWLLTALALVPVDGARAVHLVAALSCLVVTWCVLAPLGLALSLLFRSQVVAIGVGVGGLFGLAALTALLPWQLREVVVSALGPARMPFELEDWSWSSHDPSTSAAALLQAGVALGLVGLCRRRLLPRAVEAGAT